MRYRTSRSNVSAADGDSQTRQPCRSRVRHDLRSQAFQSGPADDLDASHGRAGTWDRESAIGMTYGRRRLASPKVPTETESRSTTPREQFRPLADCRWPVQRIIEIPPKSIGRRFKPQGFPVTLV